MATPASKSSRIRLFKRIDKRKNHSFLVTVLSLKNEVPKYLRLNSTYHVVHTHPGSSILTVDVVLKANVTPFLTLLSIDSYRKEFFQGKSSIIL